MPVYEYGCRSCGHSFELRQKFSDAPATECPSCSGAVEKMISRTAFALKGGGWYSEGYAPAKQEKKGGAAPACPSGGSCAGCPSAAA